MPPLHLRLIVSNPTAPDLVAVIGLLRSAGHLVTLKDSDSIPAGFPPTPDLVVSEGAGLLHPESLADAEARHIAAVLSLTGGNKRQTALLLGIARSTLLAKIRRYGLEQSAIG